MTASIEEILGGIKPPRNSATITLRADLLARHSELKRAHADAIRDDFSSNDGPQAPRIMEELRELEAEIADSQIVFTFEALGGHRYKRLRAAHPPTKEQRREGYDFNPGTFPAALLAACSIDPQMDEDQARELEDRLSDGQFTKLWNTAITLNVGDDAAPKSVLPSVLAGSNDGSSSTASPEGSPAASSLAE